MHEIEEIGYNNTHFEFNRICLLGSTLDWASDESFIVFSRGVSSEDLDEHYSSLCLHSLNNKNQKELLVESSINILEKPNISNNGDYVAYTTFHHCNLYYERCDDKELSHQVNVVNLQTKESVTIFDSSQNELDVYQVSEVCEIHWSPDDQFLIFDNVCNEDAEKKFVWVLDLESKILRAVLELESGKEFPYLYQANYWFLDTQTLLIGLSQTNYDTYLSSGQALLIDIFSGQAIHSFEPIESFHGAGLAWSGDLNLIAGNSLPTADGLKETEFWALEVEGPELNRVAEIPVNSCGKTQNVWAKNLGLLANTNSSTADECRTGHIDVAIYPLDTNALTNITKDFVGESQIVGWVDP